MKLGATEEAMTTIIGLSKTSTFQRSL